VEAQKGAIASLTEALCASASSKPSHKAAATSSRPESSTSSPTPRAAAAFAVAAAAAARVPGKRPASAKPAAEMPEELVAQDDEDPELLSLMRRTEELQKAAEEATEALSGDPGALEAQPELLAKLGALMREKDDLEARLRREQADLEKQLQGFQVTRQ